MTGRENEFEQMKAIDLRIYAVEAHRYELDVKPSSVNSAVMRGPGADKIIVTKARDGHGGYSAAYDPSDRGSIVDFAQERGAGSPGEARKLLRPGIGASSSPPPLRPAKSAYIPDLKPIERDTAAVRARSEEMRTLEHGGHAHLTGERHIPEDRQELIADSSLTLDGL